MRHPCFLVFAWVLVIVQGGVLVVDALLMHALVQGIPSRLQCEANFSVGIRFWARCDRIDVGDSALDLLKNVKGILWGVDRCITAKHLDTTGVGRNIIFMFVVTSADTYSDPRRVHDLDLGRSTRRHGIVGVIDCDGVASNHHFHCVNRYAYGFRMPLHGQRSS